jgi:hypothetical protein
MDGVLNGIHGWAVKRSVNILACVATGAAAPALKSALRGRLTKCWGPAMGGKIR